VHTYNQQGLLERVEYRTWCEDGSGYLERVYTYEYDAAGRVVGLHYEGGSGDSFTDAYVYDAAGRVSKETFTNSDGSVDVMLYTRNSSGQPLVEERRYADSADYQLIHTYDEAGNQLTLTTVYLEGDSAGVKQRCYVTTYDDCGNPLTEDYSQACNAVVTQRTTWSYACFEQ
jgi:hypothetical protein